MCIHNTLYHSTIFKTITDESTGAVKSVGLFGKTLKELFANIKTNGLLNSIFNTSSIDTKAIDAYNKAITEATKNNVSMADKQQIMQTAMEGTNKETARLIKSTQGNIVKQKQLKAAQDATTLSAKAGKVALKGLAMAGNMIAMWAISEVIGGVINYLDELSHKAQNIAEEAESKFSESNEKNETYKQNIKSLDEYKQKYQEILNSNDSEIGKRKSLLELQGNINKLVGTQCEGLDLVNGKLDDQITKIEEITKSQKEQYYQNSVGNYTNAKRAANSSTGQVDKDGVTKVYEESNPDKDLVKILQENGYGDLYKSASGNFFVDLFSFGNSGGSINIDDGIDAYGNVITSLEDRVVYLKKLQEVLLKNGKGDSDLYGVVTSQIQKWEDSLKSQKSSAEDVIKSYIDLNANPENINSVDDYKKYIDAFTDEIKKDKNVSQIIKDGVLNDEDIKTIVNDYISVLDGFSEWYDKWKNKTTKTANNSDSKTKSFDEVWSGLKESEQNKFTKLVNNGKLTAETFDKIGSSATALKETGLSVEDLCDKIRSLVGLEQKLNNLSNSMKKVGTAYKDYKKNGYVSSTSLNSMPDSFKNLDGYSKFSKIAGSKKSSKSDIQDAFNDIVTEYVKTSNILDDVTEKNKNKVITGLRDVGIINAKKVVDAFLNSSDKQFSKLSSKFNKMSNSELQNFIKMLNQKGKVSGDFYKKIGVNNANMINGLSKQYQTDLVNWIKLCEKKRDAYNQLVKAVGGNNTKEAKKNYVKLVTKDESKLTAEDMGAYEAAQKGGIITKTDKKGKVTAATKYDSQQKKLEKKLGLKLAKVNFDVDYKPTSASGSGSGSGSKGSKGDSSKSKELFNWIERKLDRLNTKLDLVKAKYDNLPLSKKNSISLLEAENKNLDEQIKLLKQVQSVNDKSYSKYMKKANSVGLKSSSLKKKVQNGQIKGSYEKLIKEYGEKTANKIKKYQDYYDKAQSAKKNSEDAKKSITDAKIQKYTNDKEYYDTLIAINQANQTKAKGLVKNDYVKSEIANTKESYNNQIKIAKLQGKYNEAKQLQIEKENKIIELQRQQVENIKTYYDNQVGILNNDEKEIQNKIDLLEAQGNIVSKSYYSSMSGVENQKMADRQAELNKLKGELAKVAPGSDDWYELQNDIQSVEDSINESQKAIVENTKAIGELNDAMYAEINAIAENLGSEFDFIGGLARGETSDSDTGRLTDTGLLQLYTSGLSYSTYKATLAQSNQRLKEIQEANKQGKLLEGYTSLESQKKAENEIAKTAQEQANSVKSYGDKIIEIVKDAISSMTEHLQDLIDARKKSLDEEKDLRDYERSILEKTKNVSSLQKQYMAATGDTSEEGRLRMAQLRKSLDEAQQDLQDTEYDKYISDQQEMLDNLMSEYTDLMEKLQKNEDELLKQGIQAINANKAVMESILNKTADAYGYPTSQNLNEVITAINNGKITADIVNGEREDSVTAVIKAKCNEIIAAYNNGSSGVGDNGGDDTRGANGENASSNNSSGISNVKTHTAIIQNGNVLGGLTTYTGTTKTENSSKTLIEQAVKNLTGMGTSNYWTTKKNPSSKTNKTIKSKNWNGGKILTEKGGYALYNDLITRGLLKGKKNTLKKGKNSVKPDDMWSALNKVFANAGFRTGGIAKLVKANGEDGLMMARNGEGFVSPENVQDIRDLMSITPNLTELVSNLTKIPDFKKVIPETTKNVSIDNITFDMPNVKNVSDFTDTIKKPEQQRAFAVAIGDAIAGKKLNINRY